jgi:hypothetical protein
LLGATHTERVADVAVQLLPAGAASVCPVFAPGRVMDVLMGFLATSDELAAVAASLELSSTADAATGVAATDVVMRITAATTGNPLRKYNWCSPLSVRFPPVTQFRSTGHDEPTGWFHPWRGPSRRMKPAGCTLMTSRLGTCAGRPSDWLAGLGWVLAVFLQWHPHQLNRLNMRNQSNTEPRPARSAHIAPASAHGHQVPPTWAADTAVPIRRIVGMMTRSIADRLNANSQSSSRTTRRKRSPRARRAGSLVTWQLLRFDTLITSPFDPPSTIARPSILSGEQASVV